MAQLTENDLQLLDTADLRARAEVIRDAVAAKTISAQQVGQLFCDLTEACGDINRAVRLFLSVNVPELQNDIDARLAGADAAAANAAAEIQRSQQTRALVEALVAKLSTKPQCPGACGYYLASGGRYYLQPRASENRRGPFPALRPRLCPVHQRPQGGRSYTRRICATRGSRPFYGPRCRHS